MANMKFDINSIVKNVKNAIDPESSVPPSEEKNPLAYRAHRLNELVKELKEKHSSIAGDLGKIETNLNEVVAELQKEAAKVEEPAAAKAEEPAAAKAEEPAAAKAEEKEEEKK